MELKSVKYAAIYLRKSRAEMDKGVEVLENHKRTLAELARCNGWDYRIYEEIGSGASVEYRDELKKLLADMDNGLFDIVLVMDVDRLSRSSGHDWENIKDVFKRNAVFLQTPNALYDYNNVDNEFMGDLLAVFARFELAQIKKRYKRGKRTKSEIGHWTNGVPPIGYRYDPITKRLVIDEDKAPIVQYIKDQALNGIPLQKISFDLNKKKVPSPRQGKKEWTQVAIHRILTNQVYTGRVVFGKSSGSGHKKRPTQTLKLNAKNDWIISDPVHPVLITDEEFKAVAELIASRKKMSHRARTGVYPLSALVRCGKCGSLHSFYKRAASGKIQMKPCQRYSPTGEKCRNSGMTVAVLYQVIDDQLQRHIDRLSENQPVESGRYNELQIELKAKTELIGQINDRFDRLNELYIEGRIRTKAQYDKQLEALTKELVDTERDVEELKKALEHFQGIDPEEQLQRIMDFKVMFQNPVVSDEEKNYAAKQIISKIEYTRTGDEANVNVVLL